jgi:hypothetical protein
MDIILTNWQIFSILAFKGVIQHERACCPARNSILDFQTGKPDPEAIKALLLGPTGNLRAPTMRHGRTLLVGFEEATYNKILG